MRDAIYLRYALIPYIYTMARWSYDTGVGMCRPMYYDYPEADEAYCYEGQYMFGNDILVAPVTSSDKGTNVSEKDIWLPEGKWYEVMTGELIDGGSVVTRSFTREQIPYYYREGAIIPLYPRMMHLKNGLKHSLCSLHPEPEANLIIMRMPETTLIIKQLVHLQELRKIPRTEEPLVLFILVLIIRRYAGRTGLSS